MISDLLELVRQYVGEYGYIVIFVALFLENAAGLGVFVPGITILIFGGYFAAAGRLNLALVMAVGLGGTMLGDQVNYLIGRYGATRFKFIQRNLDRIEDVRKSIQGRKRWALLLFQFPPGGRVLFPLTLGVMRVPYFRWILLDIAATLLFVATYSGAGFGIGTALVEVANIETVNWVLQAVVGGVILIWGLTVALEVRRRWRRRRSRVPNPHHQSVDRGSAGQKINPYDALLRGQVNPANGKPIGGKATNGKPAGGKPGNDTPANNKKANGKSVDDKPVNGNGEASDRPSRDEPLLD